MASDPHILRQAPRVWTNEHLNVSRPLAERWRVTNGAPGAMPFADHCKAAATRIQSLIKRAVESGKRVRACGSRWSLSDIPVVEQGWMVETDQLAYQTAVKASNLHARYRGGPEELWLAQSGVSISRINAALEDKRHGRALRTSGASNGQTIGGMIGTGVHGSAIGVGGIESQVAGLQLITKDKIWWIEHPDAPVLSDDYIRRLGAEPKRERDLFEAALVNLGALGIVGAVLLTTTGRYKLKSATVHLPFAEAQRAMNQLDFARLDQFGLPRDPYFFQTIMDPGSMAIAYTTIRYKTTCRPDYDPDYNLVSGYQPGTCLPSLIGGLVGTLPDLRGPIVRALMTSMLTQDLTLKEHTPGECFKFTQARRGICSAGFAIPARETTNALEIARAAFAERGEAPVVFTCRYAQKSPAMLSFTRFEPSCVFDIDGIDTPESQKLIARVADRFDQVGMPYTQHWGKMHALTKARVRRAFGGSVDRWNATRRALLRDPAERNALSSPLLDGLGLNA